MTAFAAWAAAMPKVTITQGVGAKQLAGQDGKALRAALGESGLDHNVRTLDIAEGAQAFTESGLRSPRCSPIEKSDPVALSRRLRVRHEGSGEDDEGEHQDG